MRTRPTSGSRPQADLVDVELVDVGHLVALEDAVLDEREQPPPPDPVSRRRRRVAVAAVVSLLVAGVVVANVVEARQEAARQAAIAALPRVLPSLDQPLATRWEEDGWFAGLTGDLVLVQGSDGDVRALDPATGEHRWVHETGPSEWCWTVGYDLTTADHTLVCLAERGVEASPGTPASLEVTVLDGATGARGATLTLAGRQVAADAVDEDLLLVVALPDGRLHAVRWRPTTGETLWDVTSAEPVLDDGVVEIMGWGRDGDVFQITTVSGNLGYDVETGEEVETSAVEGASWVDTVDLPDGASATWTYSERGDGSGAVLEPDGSVRFHLPGPVRQAGFDDGSAPGVLVAGEVDGGTVRGLDVRTGEALWSVEAPGAWPLLVLEGRMLLVGDGLVMVDLRDGSELWSVPGGTGYWQDPLTDGEAVLFLESDGARAVLVARQLSDGAEVWRTSVPPGTYGATATPSGQVLLHGESRVVGLG